MYPRDRRQPDQIAGACCATLSARRRLRASAGLTAGLLLGCVAPGTFHLVDGADPGTRMHLAVENHYSAPVDVYLRMGSARIHLLQVPATSSASIAIPPALAGRSAVVIVWVHGEQQFVSTSEVLLAADTSLELTVSPANPPVYLVRRG